MRCDERIDKNDCRGLVDRFAAQASIMYVFTVELGFNSENIHNSVTHRHTVVHPFIVEKLEYLEQVTENSQARVIYRS